jgi:hypothetical protein
MMHYVFSAAIQALIDSGQLVQVISKTGDLLPIARDPATGRFVEMAIGTTSSFNPLVMPVQMAMGGLQMYQNHRGFTKVLGGIAEIQQTLGVLQATTALIGVGTVANIAISAANLHQILQLREDVRQMRVEIKDGFIDLKQALKEQGAEILIYIDQVAQDIKFEQHRVVLSRAYSKFLGATKRIQSALACENIAVRDMDLANARQTLTESLDDYRNFHLLPDISPLGKLRRMECAWSIEQTIIMTYQIQKQSKAVSCGLSNLQASIRQDIVDVSNSVRSQEEIDFIYPEIRRICTQDLAVLSSWQEQAEWIQSLPASDLKLLESSEPVDVSLDSTSTVNSLEMPEQEIYDDIKPKSHFDSLRDQLQLMALPELRLKYENYVVAKAQAFGHKALSMETLKQSSDMAIANLYHYFREEPVRSTLT